MYRIGVVGTRGGWSTERLADAVQRLTGHRIIVEMEHLRLDMPQCKAYYGAIALNGLDALIVKKIGGNYSHNMLDRLEILRLLSERGLNIYSDPLKIIRVIDRLSCTITLQSAGVPMPPTTITENIDHAIDAIGEYGEAVLKPLYSTKARGMLMLKHGNGARKSVMEFMKANPVMYIQKRMELPGRDLGIVFLGGEYLATYSRKVGSGAWTSSTAYGGTYEAHKPSRKIIELAEKAQALFGLDFTCVDIVETSSGPMLFEVSAFGGFRGISKTSDLDVAGRYAQYVIDRIKG